MNKTACQSVKKIYVHNTSSHLLEVIDELNIDFYVNSTDILQTKFRKVF
jgi:hypothetical protein